eukprot:5435323-Lingulodinium_polyedra.AAC.1
MSSCSLGHIGVGSVPKNHEVVSTLGTRAVQLHAQACHQPHRRTTEMEHGTNHACHFVKLVPSVAALRGSMSAFGR